MIRISPDFCVEFQNFRILQFFDFFLKFFILNRESSPWSSWTANIDKKYMELNEAALNVNKPCVTSRKTAFLKDK